MVLAGKKSSQRWLWSAVDHASNTVLAYTFGKPQDAVFNELKTLLDPFEIRCYYTDGWGAYERHLEVDKHQVGKQNTQKKNESAIMPLNIKPQNC